MSSYEGPMSVRAEELPELYALLNQVFRPERGNMECEYPRHVGLNNLDNVRVVKQDGKIVSHVATTVRPVNLCGIQTAVAGIGAVATHADARGQGLASVLMQDAVERSRAQGADVMLISGDEHIYLRMHAAYCGRYVEVKVDKRACGSRLNVSLLEANEGDLQEIVRLRMTHPVRYLFPLEDLRALLKCRFAFDMPVSWWLIRIDEEIAGWAVIHPRGEDLLLVDWAGSVEAIQEAAGVLIDYYEANTCTYIAPHISLIPLPWRRHILRIRLFEGTVFIIHAGRFLQRARAYFIERIGEEIYGSLQIQGDEQRVIFRYQNEEVVFEDGGELAMLFFGHPERDILREKVPAENNLSEMLSRMFPIPLVWYGIGYV